MKPKGRGQPNFLRSVSLSQCCVGQIQRSSQRQRDPNNSGLFQMKVHKVTHTDSALNRTRRLYKGTNEGERNQGEQKQV